MNTPSSLEGLIGVLRCLPGGRPEIDPRSAWLITCCSATSRLHCGWRRRSAMRWKASSIAPSATIFPKKKCVLCRSSRRYPHLLCVVEMPMGGELEYVDSGTLAQAVLERREVMG